MGRPETEKRRSPRVKHNSVLEILDPSGKIIDAVARLVDVSQVGACFATQHPFKKGEKIRARLRLLKEGVLNITGHVVWSREKGNSTLYGVEFDSAKSSPQRLKQRRQRASYLSVAPTTMRFLA